MEIGSRLLDDLPLKIGLVISSDLSIAPYKTPPHGLM